MQSTDQIAMFICIVAVLAAVAGSFIRDLFGTSPSDPAPPAPGPQTPEIRETGPAQTRPGGYVRDPGPGYTDADMISILKAYEAGRQAAARNRDRSRYREPDRRYRHEPDPVRVNDPRSQYRIRDRERGYPDEY